MLIKKRGRANSARIKFGSSPFVSKMSEIQISYIKRIQLFLFPPYNKHLINRAKSVCMGESWPRSFVQTSLRSACTYDLGQDSPIQTSWLVSKSWIMPKGRLKVTGSQKPSKTPDNNERTYQPRKFGVYGENLKPPPCRIDLAIVRSIP